MKKGIQATLILLSAFGAMAPAGFAKEGKKGGSALLLPAIDVKWQDVPDFPGVKMAVLEGDPAKGPNHILIKLQDGFAAPLHHHSSDHFVTVVSGTLSLTVDGKETRLPPGSFFLFRGRKQHITRCVPGADCVLSIDARGKWDVVPEKAEPAAAQ
jgi:quercetin dioxygenase-like cupin family protein